MVAALLQAMKCVFKCCTQADATALCGKPYLAFAVWQQSQGSVQRRLSIMPVVHISASRQQQLHRPWPPLLQQARARGQEVNRDFMEACGGRGLTLDDTKHEPHW
jgi:hypothetical protein